MTRALQIAACLLLSASCVAVAQTPAPAPNAPTAPAAPATTTPPAVAPAAAPAPTGDAKRGHQLSYTCQGCHGITGYRNAYPNYHVPRIGGQTPQYLVNALTEYRKGTRRHPTMEAQAQSFSDQDIADIAAFLSEVKP